MTPGEAVTQALRHTAAETAMQIPVEKLSEVLRALNGAVQTWYALAPRIYRRTPVTHRIPAPRALTLDVTQYNATVGLHGSESDPFAASELWQSVILENEAYLYPNRIAATDAVFHAPRCLSGQTAATIYFDAIVFADFTVDRVVGTPLLLDGNQTISRMTRATSNLGFERRVWGEQWEMSYSSRLTSTRPTTFSVEGYGHSRATDPDAHFGLRLFPLPTAESTISLEVDLLPRAYGPLDLRSETLQLPVPNEQIELTLMPILEYNLARSTLFTGSSGVRQLLAQAANDAKTQLRFLNPDHANTPLRVGTRPGY